MLAKAASYLFVSISRHLQIADTLGIPRDGYRPLPVVKASRHGLIGLARLNGEPYIAGFQLPLDRVGLPLGAAPGFAGGEADLRRVQHPAAAVPLNQDAVAVLRFRASCLGAQAKQHQLAPIVKLERKPVPARLPLGQYRAAPLVIKPALTADVTGLPIQDQGAADGQARVGVVEGGVARALLAETRFTLQYRGLGGAHLHIKIPRLALHLEGGGKERFPLRGKPPLFQPILTTVGTGEPRPLAAGALVLLVAAFAHIRDGELGQPELRGEPGVVGCYLLLDALAKQGPLHAVAAPLLVFEVASEIPPLGAVVGVGSVIRGQVDGLTRQGLFEVIVAATQDAPQIAGLRVAAYGNKRDQAGCKPQRP